MGLDSLESRPIEYGLEVSEDPVQQVILVVDDEPQIVKSVRHRLVKEGFDIVAAHDGEDALKKFRTCSPNLVILDLMLPKMDGFEVCRSIRQVSSTPIIILSVKDDEADKITSFLLGVDDYVTKPFSPSELVMRTRAVLRRSRERTAPEKNLPVLRYPGFMVDRRRCLVNVDDRVINLTPKEFNLLWLLAAHPGYVYSREQILKYIWKDEQTTDQDNVTVLVSRLREKVEKDPANPKFIRTVWGVGYKFGLETS